VARRRDVRTIGRGPYVLGLRRNDDRWRDGFPFEVPAVAAIEQLRLDSPITLLAGDNGSGKSTIVEALAKAMGFGDEGGEFVRLGELPPVPRPVFDDALEPVLTSTKPRGGYFLRAESFFNIAAFVDSGGIFSPDLSLYGDVPLHEQSHGQSFLSLAANRFGGESLYLFDEPEAALSLSGVLALVAIVVRAARAGAQFVIATHSPVLLACPRARIYELDDDGIATREYDDLEVVRLTRAFLDAPERFLRAALDDSDDDGVD
jgi:predicted ATPase